MDCKEAQRLIRPFLMDELDENKKNEFIMHVNACRECMEDLKLDFLVTEGVLVSDDRRDVDFEQMFQERLNLVLQKNRLHRFCRAGIVAVSAMVACILFLVSSAGFLF